MLIERMYDEDLAQAAYLIGCQQNGEAIIIDGRRDVKPLLALAERHGMKIVAAAETHIHADYLSGTREIAEATGATPYVSGEGGAEWQYDFEAERLHDGDEITIGNITIRAVHTPGHTPEHLSFLVTDGAFSDEPGYFFTGDFVFSGDVGRPDLLDEAAGGVDTRFLGAKQQFESLREHFLTLPDHVMVYPGHGAGSACGKALGALPSTTVGYERRFAWWAKYLDENDEQGFVDELLAGQPDAPQYFGRMKRQNRQGPDVMGTVPEMREFKAEQVQAGIDARELVLLDTRPMGEINAETVLGSLAVPNLGKLATWGSWAIDPETDSREIVVLGDAALAQRVWDHLVRVGIDSVVGYVPSIAGLDTFTPEIVAVEEVADFDRAVLLDVRTMNEYNNGHLPGAKQLHAGKLLWRADELPAKDEKVLLYCQSGARATVAANALRAVGYDVAQVDGSYLGWVAADMPIEK